MQKIIKRVSVKKTAPSRNKIKVLDPFSYLKEDHKKVSALMKAIEKTTERGIKTRKELFGRLKLSLTRHAHIEEKVVYPVLEEIKKTHDITLEGFEEHHVVKILLKELTKMSPAKEEWTAKFAVLKENVDHHVKEEEGEMFTKARAALPQDKLEKLGNRVALFLKK